MSDERKEIVDIGQEEWKVDETCRQSYESKMSKEENGKTTEDELIFIDLDDEKPEKDSLFDMDYDDLEDVEMYEGNERPRKLWYRWTLNAATIVIAFAVILVITILMLKNSGSDSPNIGPIITETTQTPENKPAQSTVPSNTPESKPTQSTTPSNTPGSKPAQSTAPSNTPTSKPAQSTAPSNTPTSKPVQSTVPTNAPTSESGETTTPTSRPSQSTSAPTETPGSSHGQETKPTGTPESKPGQNTPSTKPEETTKPTEAPKPGVPQDEPEQIPDENQDGGGGIVFTSPGSVSQNDL